MNSLSIFWQLVLADFRERTRRYSYLITLMVALFVGYLVLTDKYSFHFGSYKPILNSAWIGTTMALAGAVMFTLMGFYIVRSAISRDRERRVGEILATTALSNLSYLLAKFVSNLMVLWSMVAMLTLTALLGIFWAMPLKQIDLTAVILPFLFFPLVITIPVAGAAVLFDTVRWLRGVIGNIIYFFFAQFMIVSGLLKLPYFDASGMGLFEVSVKEAIHSAYPGVDIPMTIGFVSILGDKTNETINQFVWNGIDWTLPLLTSRLFWPAIAFVMLLIALLLFDRFEQSKKPKGKKHRSQKAADHKPDRIDLSQTDSAFGTTRSYRKIPIATRSMNILPLVLAELKLSFSAISSIWKIIGLVLIVGQLMAPFDIARTYIIPASMIWPLLIWSSLGTRETRFNMHSLMFSSIGVHTRQFYALVISGLAVSLASCLPIIIRATVADEMVYSTLLISAALMIPTAAFAIGSISGSRKLFEIAYPMIWYAGSIDQIKAIDLLGTSEVSVSLTRATLFVLLAIIAASIAYFGRKREV